MYGKERERERELLSLERDDDNSWILDYIKEDQQLQEYIDENEKIIEKYHRKMEEIFQIIREYSDNGEEISWSPIALDYKKLENEQKHLCEEKKKKLADTSTTNPSPTESGDQGVYL